MRRLLTLLLIATLIGLASAGAQSLADVAKKEEARRRQVTKPSPVYTDKDVKPAAPAPSAGPAGAETAPTPAQGDSEAAAKPPAKDGDEPALTDEEQRAADEQRWRSRITDARAALERNKVFAEALQSRINSLWADFTARDDPAQRAVIETERKKAIAQLDRVKSEIVEQTKAIADIEEEARKAGVPPGWLR